MTAMGLSPFAEVVTFTMRANAARARIISARPMHRKERKTYEQETQTCS
jgi:uncharacterized DUF497 family protein